MAVVVAACGATTSLTPTPRILEPGPGGTVPTLRPGVDIVTQFTGTAWDMAYDSKRDALWIPVLGEPGGSNELIEWSASGKVGTWTLPDDLGHTMVELGLQVHVGPDESVWIATADRVLRFDPATATLKAAPFTSPPPGALPRAGENVPGNGSDITAIGLLSSGALVARRNVPFLTRLDTSLAETGTIPLPDGDIAAHDLAVTLDGTIYVATGPPPGDTGATVDAFSAGGTLLRSFPISAGRLAVVGNEVLAAGGSTQAEWLAMGASPQPETGLPIDAGMPVTPDPRGGLDAVLGPRIVHVEHGAVVSEVDIPTGMDTHAGYASGVPIFTPTVVVTDSHDVTWLLGDQVLVRATL